MTDQEIRNLVDRHDTGCLTFLWALTFSIFATIYVLTSIVIPGISCPGSKSDKCKDFYQSWQGKLWVSEIEDWR